MLEGALPGDGSPRLSFPPEGLRYELDLALATIADEDAAEVT